MKLYSQSQNSKLYQGDMRELNSIIANNSIDAIITDPPYELNFMNKGWDNSGIAFQKETWEKCYQVLKPGGYLLAFGGSRTFHRIACAIEDAGFEIRDTIMWLYGSGFPHSMDIGKAVESKVLNGNANTQAFKHLRGTKAVAGNWGINKNVAQQGCRPTNYDLDKHERTVDVEYQTNEGLRWNGWGTALKPSYEPIIVARKPCDGSCTDNILKYGVGGLNIDECRIGNETIKGGTMPDFRDVGQKSKMAIGIDKLSFGQVENAERIPLADHIGRFPANTILTYDEADFDEVCGALPRNDRPNGSITKKYKINNQVYGEYGYCNEWEAYQDSGSAARYFYCAKASKKDRDEGCDFLEGGTLHRVNGGHGLEDSSKFAPVARKNTHPTVKPTELMQYLVRLVAPNGATILDPFMGSGSTGKAVMYENAERKKDYKFIGIELTEEYLPIAKARVENIKIEKNDQPCLKTEPIYEQLTIEDI